MDQQNAPTAMPPAPLVEWKNPPTVADLKQDLEAAKPIHETQVSKIQVWLDNLNVTGSAKPPASKKNSTIVPKLIRKQAEWRYAALSEPFLSTEDLFNVTPVTWEDRDAARQNQLLLNHQFNTRIDKQRFIDEYVRTAVDEGTVIVKTGWIFEDKIVTEQVPVVEFQENEELGPLHEQLHQMMTESPSQWQTDVPEELKQAHKMTMELGVPIEPVITGYKEEKVTKVVRNHPTAEIRPFRNVIIDPTAQGDIKKAQFAIDSFESCLSDLKKDSRYKNLEYINLSGNSLLAQPDLAASTGVSDFNFKDDPRKKFWVHEYWGYRDIDGSGIVKPFVAAWVGDVMIRLQESPFPDGELPFVVEQYLPVRKANHGEPDGALLEDNQKIMGAVTRGMIDLMGKSANSQTGMRKDMLDATNRRRYENGQDYEFNPNVDPRLGVHMHTFPEIPNSAQFMLQLQNAEAESLTGVKSFSQGISGASLGDVAAGVRGALDAASKRELGILRRLSNGIISIGRKFISMNAELLSDEEVVRITNEEFVAVKRDDLPGNFDLKLSISTAEEDDNKARELAFMLQTMGNNMDPAMGRMVLADIARLRKMPDLAKRIEAYQPQPDPLEQRRRELEVILLEAQIANEQAQAAQRNAAAGLSAAKSGTEGAKTENVRAETDLKNLEFVEQESGVHQEREIQRIGEQARSQMELKAMDQAINESTQRFELLREYVKSKAKPK